MKKSTAIIVISILLTAVIATSAYAVYERDKRIGSENVDRLYAEQALGSLIYSAIDLDQSLASLKYADSIPLSSRLLAEITRSASDAVIALESLPYTGQELDKLSAFFASTADFATTMLWYTSEGAETDERQSNSLENIAEQANTLKSELVWIGRTYGDGALEMDSYGDNSDTMGESTVGAELMRVNEAMSPFSELIDGFKIEEERDEKPEEISEEEGKSIVSQFLGLPEQSVSFDGEYVGGLSCLLYSVVTTDGDEERISITLYGGKIAQWYDSERPDSGDIDEETAKETAKKFVKVQGMDDLEEFSSGASGGVYNVDFMRVRNGVSFTGDIVTVGVNLQTGEVCSFVASDYYSSDADSVNLEVGISEDEARTHVPESLEIVSVGLVVSELEKGIERLCYEFVCSAPEGEVVVYVDAETGYQEKISVSRT